MAHIVAVHSWETDLLERMSCTWVGVVAPAVGKFGYDVYEAFGLSASRQNPLYQQYMDADDVKLITGLAHGKPDAFTGSDGHVLYVYPIPNGGYPELNGRIVHLTSCSTARQLGANLVAQGCCLAYIGYIDDVPIDTDAQFSCFLNCDAVVEKSLVAGLSVADAVQAAKRSFEGANLGGIGNKLAEFPPGSSEKLSPFPPSTPSNLIVSRATPELEAPRPSAIVSRAL